MWEILQSLLVCLELNTQHEYFPIEQRVINTMRGVWLSPYYDLVVFLLLLRSRSR